MGNPVWPGCRRRVCPQRRGGPAVPDAGPTPSGRSTSSRSLSLRRAENVPSTSGRSSGRLATADDRQADEADALALRLVEEAVAARLALRSARPRVAVLCRGRRREAHAGEAQVPAVGADHHPVGAERLDTVHAMGERDLVRFRVARVAHRVHLYQAPAGSVPLPYASAAETGASSLPPILTVKSRPRRRMTRWSPCRATMPPSSTPACCTLTKDSAATEAWFATGGAGIDLKPPPNPAAAEVPMNRGRNWSKPRRGHSASSRYCTRANDGRRRFGRRARRALRWPGIRSSRSRAAVSSRARPAGGRPPGRHSRRTTSRRRSGGHWTAGSEREHPGGHGESYHVASHWACRFGTRLPLARPVAVGRDPF